MVMNATNSEEKLGPRKPRNNPTNRPGLRAERIIMEFTKVIETAPPEMELVADCCTDEAMAFEEIPTEPIYKNVNVAQMPWHESGEDSCYDWENRLGNSFDGFMEGFCNNDVFRTADGKFWAVERMWLDKFGGYAPIYWREVVRKEQKND